MSTSEGGTVPHSAEHAGRWTLANRYAVHEVLGRGGMGVVWGAEDTVIGRAVAIKELKLPQGIPDAEREVYEQRVLREARTAGRLNDPAVVTVYDVLTEGGTTYIVMERIEAATLADLLRDRGPLPPEQVLAIADAVLSALDTAHAAGIVHRDVKPSNIMLLAGGRVKLTDFGIAQALDDPRLTTTGGLVGSPTFMAPERIAHATATPASDLWSLGATLFNAVEGYPAFERESTAATMHAITSGQPPAMQRAHGVVASIIGGLLATAPEARLNSPGVRALLATARSGGPTGAFPGPAPGMRGGTMVYGAGSPTAVAAQPDVRGKPGRGKRVAVLALVALVAAGIGLGAGYLAFRGGVLGGGSPTYQAISYGRDGKVPTFSLTSSLGECLTALPKPGARITDAQTGDCQERHVGQMYYQFDLFSTADIDYPGDAALTKIGDGMCSLTFDSSLVTSPGKDSTLTHTALYPTRAQWNASTSEADARAIYCVLYRTDGGTLRTSMIGGN